MYHFPSHLNYVAALPWEVKTVQTCCKYKTERKQHALIFACAQFNGSHSLTYYFSLWLLLNILLNNTVLCKEVKMLTAPLHIGDVTQYDFSRRLHLLHWTRSGATKQPIPQSGLLQDTGCHLAVSYFSCQCITLTNRSSAC